MGSRAHKTRVRLMRIYAQRETYAPGQPNFAQGLNKPSVVIKCFDLLETSHLLHKMHNIFPYYFFNEHLYNFERVSPCFKVSIGSFLFYKYIVF